MAATTTKRKTKKNGVIGKAGNYMIGVQEAREYLGCGQSKAYAVIRSLRQELIDSGKMTEEVSVGKVPKKYFLERCYLEE